MAADEELSGMAILEKAGAVLDALDVAGEATVSRIAEAVGEPVSSTYRLLASLTSIGWVDPGSRRGRYRLGLEVVRIGDLLEDRLDVRQACETVLRDLRDATRTTSFLCYRRGTSAVCVDRVGGTDVQSLAMRVGDSFELYRGAAPMAILAFLPLDERERVLEQFDARRSAGEAIPERTLLEAGIDEARALGVAVSDESVTPGIAAVGAPLLNHRGELEGAISISGLRSRLFAHREDLIATVRRAGERASEALGFAAVPGGSKVVNA